MTVTQTLQFILDVREAVRHLFGGLRPGGVLVATVPGISQVSRCDMDRGGEYWRLTSLGAKRLFEEFLPSRNVEVNAHGNVLAAIAFLHGLAAEELGGEELDYRDPDYELLVTICAVKPDLRGG